MGLPGPEVRRGVSLQSGLPRGPKPKPDIGEIDFERNALITLGFEVAVQTRARGGARAMGLPHGEGSRQQLKQQG
jgi:hypothetical protein